MVEDPVTIWSSGRDHSPAADSRTTRELAGPPRWSRRLIWDAGTFGITLSCTTRVGEDPSSVTYSRLFLRSRFRTEISCSRLSRRACDPETMLIRFKVPE